MDCKIIGLGVAIRPSSGETGHAYGNKLRIKNFYQNFRNRIPSEKSPQIVPGTVYGASTVR